jgi:hypothetical protein
VRSTSAFRTAVVAILATGALIATGVAGATATAADGPTGAPSPTGPLQTVQLALTPRDPAGLRALADDADTAPRATRLAHLDTVLAGPERAALVANRARTLGFTVTAMTSTSVTLSGPASLIREQFGSARAQDPTENIGRALPTMPASFRGLVTAAAGGDDPRPVRRSAAALTQAQARAMYSIPTPSVGKPNAGSPAIATIQFSSWFPNDLKLYAQSTGVYGGDTTYNPLTSGAFTAVTVDGGPPPADPNHLGGPTEVALDQSALATVAPNVRQVAYFAPNTPLAQADVVNQIVSEASGRNIVAISTSWGLCEQDLYPDAYAHPTDPTQDPIFAADLQAIQAARAAGLTLFAAAGDSGVADCANDTSAAVDTPASFPGVIGVGGTHVGQTSETAWANSGGGYSGLFCTPSAQAPSLPVVATDCRSGPGKARGVPDLALDADPSTGLSIYVNGSHVPVGGTSLAAPLAAGSFVASELGAGIIASDTDVPSWLYANSSTFFDIISTSGGGVRATPGWDPITGLGSPNWLTTSWSSLQKAAILSPATLAPGQQLISANQQYRAVMQGDGNLVLYGPDGVLWSSGTWNNPGAALSVQADGNLVIYSAGKPIWVSNTFNNPGGVTLSVNNNGTLGLFKNGIPLWQVADRMTAPRTLQSGQSLVSTNGRSVNMQTDGNLVVRSGATALWSTNTWGKPGAYLAIQGDGNLVIRRNGVVLWSSGTYNTGAHNLFVIQGDGNLVLYSGTKAVWNSHTHG